MKVEGIIPAAGFSSRAGAYKLTLKLGTKTVLERCIEGMYDICSRIIVVGGYNMGTLVPIVAAYPKAELIYNRNYEKGMLSSVTEGYLRARGDRIFLTPGDFPLIGEDIYRCLLDADSDIVVPTYRGEKGHPLLMSARMVKTLLTGPVWASLDDFINRCGYSTKEVGSPVILMDIDTPEDYVHAEEYFHSRLPA